MSLKTYINDEIQAFRKKATGDLNFGIQYSPTKSIVGIHDAYPYIITTNPILIELVKIKPTGTYNSLTGLYDFQEIKRYTLPLLSIQYDVTAGQYLVDKSIDLNLVMDNATYFIEFSNGTDIFKTESFCANEAFDEQITPIGDSLNLSINTSLGVGNSFTLPLPSGPAYDFWWSPGDGSIDLHVTAFDDPNITYNYASPFAGQIKIGVVVGDKCGGFGFDDLGDKLKITSVDNWGDVEFDNISGMWYGCTNLTVIPNSPMTGIDNILTLNGVFRNTRITSIPDEMFKYAVNTGNALETFRDCTALTTIGVDIFRYCVNITTFAQCFQNCTVLQSIPVDTYRYNVNATNFGITHFNNISLNALPNNLFFYNKLATGYVQTFNSCRNILLPAVIFDLSVLNIVTSFDAFMGASNTLFSYTGTIQDIWNYALSATSVNAFLNQTTISNYPAIPNGWKGL